VQVFVRTRPSWTRSSALVQALNTESLLWISFPKGRLEDPDRSDRDKGWEAVEAGGLKWINLVSVNDTWSAFALRPYRPGEPRQSFR
jgi:hypothetical protein